MTMRRTGSDAPYPDANRVLALVRRRRRCQAGAWSRLPSFAAGRLTVAVNTADDFEHLGLHVSPDLDTVLYTLAGLSDPVRGWGRAGESWNFMSALSALGGETWFALGDRDLAVHVERTRRLRAGETLSTIVADMARRLKVAVRDRADDGRAGAHRGAHARRRRCRFRTISSDSAACPSSRLSRSRARPRRGPSPALRRRRSADPALDRDRDRSLQSVSQHRSDPRRARSA